MRVRAAAVFCESILQLAAAHGIDRFALRTKQTMNHEGHKVSRRRLFQGFSSGYLVSFVVILFKLNRLRSPLSESSYAFSRYTVAFLRSSSLHLQKGFNHGLSRGRFCAQ
jgi:hypothetical protein